MAYMKSKFQIESLYRGQLEEEEGLEDQAPPPPSSLTNVPLDSPDILTKKTARFKLCMLGKTDDGDRYAYLKIECTDMGLTDISVVAHFRYLQYVDVSRNKLDLGGLHCLASLPFLILIQADDNRIESVALRKMKYLQVIIMNNNAISSLWDLYQPEMTCIELANNNITELTFARVMKELLCLDLHFNSIKALKGIDFPKLDSLYLGQNQMKSLEGIDKLPNLRVLHLRNNPLSNLKGFSKEQTRLSYINLRACKVDNARQIRKLKVLTGLKEIVLLATPYMGGTGSEEDEIEEDDPDKRLEILSTLPTLVRINKAEVTRENRLEAKQLVKEKIEGEDEEEEAEEAQAEEEGLGEQMGEEQKDE